LIPKKWNQKRIKLLFVNQSNFLRVYGGCLGTKSEEGRGVAAISLGEMLAIFDPGIS
jgi:hypothetical protein